MPSLPASPPKAEDGHRPSPVTSPPYRPGGAEHGHEVHPAHSYCDEGGSGARADRPARARLREAAHDGAFAMVAVWSPARFARKYAHHVLLLEECRRGGGDVVFLHPPLSDEPQDQLLAQIPGAMAAYERALLHPLTHAIGATTERDDARKTRAIARRWDARR